MTATTLGTHLTAQSSDLLIRKMTETDPNFLQLLELDRRLTALLELDSTKELVLVSPWLRLVSSASFHPDRTQSLEAHALARTASMRFMNTVLTPVAINLLISLSQKSLKKKIHPSESEELLAQTSAHLASASMKMLALASQRSFVRSSAHYPKGITPWVVAASLRANTMGSTSTISLAQQRPPQ